MRIDLIVNLSYGTDLTWTCSNWPHEEASVWCVSGLTVLVKCLPSSTGSLETKQHLHMDSIPTCKYSHRLHISFVLFIYFFFLCSIVGFEDIKMCNFVTWYSATFILNSSEQQQQIIIRVLCDIIFWKRLIRLDISTCSHTVFRSWTQGLYFSQIGMDWFLHSVNYLL